MDGPRGYYAKCNKSDRQRQISKDKYCIISLICEIKKNKQTNETKQKQTHGYREQNGGCRGGHEVGAKQVKGIKRYKPPVTK